MSARAAVDWRAMVPEGADGMTYGVEIHRRVPPAGWPAALEVVPPERRPVAECYLRGIATRLRIVRASRAASAASTGLQSGAAYNQRGDGSPIMEPQPHATNRDG